MFTAWYGHLQTAGNAYLEAVSLRGEVRELYALRPDRVQPVAGARAADAYEYSVDGRTTRLARDADGFLPVLHARLFHPLDDRCGLSPIEAAAVAIDVHNAGARWAKALLDNAARPSGALIYRGPDGAPNLTDEQFTRIKRELEDAYQGVMNAGPADGAGRRARMARRCRIRPPTWISSPRAHAAAREIALAFGVPPMLLGIPGDNTYANYKRSEPRLLAADGAAAGGKDRGRAILARICAVLHLAELTLDGQTLVDLRFVTSQVIRESDGETFHGIARYRAVTECTVKSPPPLLRKPGRALLTATGDTRHVRPKRQRPADQARRRRRAGNVSPPSPDCAPPRSASTRRRWT